VILALLLTLFLPEKKKVLQVNLAASPKKSNRTSCSDDSDITANSEAAEKMPMLYETDS
jgi:hypothetical protein